MVSFFLKDVTKTLMRAGNPGPLLERPRPVRWRVVCCSSRRCRSGRCRWRTAWRCACAWSASRPRTPTRPSSSCEYRSIPPHSGLLLTVESLYPDKVFLFLYDKNIIKCHLKKMSKTGTVEANCSFCIMRALLIFY